MHEPLIDRSPDAGDRLVYDVSELWESAGCKSLNAGSGRSSVDDGDSDNSECECEVPDDCVECD